MKPDALDFVSTQFRGLILRSGAMFDIRSDSDSIRTDEGSCDSRRRAVEPPLDLVGHRLLAKLIKIEP